MSADMSTRVATEIAELSNNEQYKTLRPLLENLQIMANASYPPEVVKGVLELVKQMQSEAVKVGSTSQVADKAAAGLIQPNWKVDGDVNNANRDLINNTFKIIVNNNLKELKEEEPDQGIPVSVVLVVMTASEAAELVSLKAFSDYPDAIYTDEFSQLQELLTKNNVANWFERYGTRTEHYKPFGDQTIGELIKSAFDDVEGFQKKLEPKFFDIHALGKDTKETRRSLRELRAASCVVVMDYVSMRHPAIQRAYRRTLLDAFPQTLIIRLNPFDDASSIQEQLIRFSERWMDLEFYKRYTVDEDANVEEVDDDLRFRRWLKEQATKLMPPAERGRTGWRGYRR